MLRTRIRVSSVILALLACAAPARALNAFLDISQYAHTAWTLRDGAFRGYPKSLAQTADGYLWLGTEFGVQRFDGVRFISWQPPAGAKLPSDSIVKLLAARDGSLWIGTARGLARWKDATLTAYDDLTGQYVAALIEDRDGTIWAGTSAGITGTARLCAVQGGRVQCHGSDGAFGRFVICLYEDARGTLWVGAATGLLQWKPGARTVVAMRDPFSEIHSVAESQNGAMLVALNREIDTVVDGRLVPYDLTGGDGRPIKPTALLRDRNGGLWIGTQDQGLLHQHRGRIDRFVRADGLSSDLVLGLFEDVEGNIWVATPNGLDRFRDFAVITFSSKQGLSSDTVLSVLPSRGGGVWLGTVGGLNQWRNGTIRPGPVAPGATAEGVASLFEDRRGRLWVSAPHGLAFFENGRFTPVPAVGKGYVHAIAEDRPESLWVSDQERGLFQLRGAEVVQLIPWTTFGGRNARALFADPRGGLWLGFFQGGVSLFKDGTIARSYGTADGLGEGEVSQFHFDADGTLWAATQGGLSRLKDGRVSTLTRQNGLPCDTIRWAMDDGAGSMWLHTACALVRVARSEIEAWTANAKHVLTLTVYDSSDGVPGHSNIGSYSPRAAMSMDGRLWFATYDGVGVLDPHHLPFNRVVPPVHIEQITADRRVYDASGDLRLPPLVRDLRIDYTALSLTAPEKVRFRYRLEGRDADWVEAGNRRQAFYTDLPPRSYRFHVIAANNDGVWNRDGAVWGFSIQPAFYQTRGFRVAAVLCLVLGSWGIYRLRLARMTERLNLRFEERLAERTRIARELHDTLLQGSLSASMQLYVLADEVADPPVRSKLDHILKRLSQVNEEGRQTVQALRAQPTASEDLEVVLARDAEELREQQAVNIRVVVEGKRQPIHPLIRDEVYRIGREVLANTFRHAAATRVDIEIEYGPDRLRVTLRDNGRGIDPSIVKSGRPGHWGILGMRERAERIGATLKLSSGLDAGTEVEAIVPAHVAFKEAAPARKPWFWWMGAGT
jgi:ligand-binding sensor domain-containing protein/signal transduction histidine kinase